MTGGAVESDVRAIVSRISYLQKQEDELQKKLVAHERTRGEPCPASTGTSTTSAEVIAVVPSDANGPCSATNKCRGIHEGNFCQGGSQDPHDGGCDQYCPPAAPFFRSDLGGCVTEAYAMAHLATSDKTATQETGGRSCLFRANGGSRYSEQLIGGISELAKERADLFESLLDTREILDRSVGNMRTDLADQLRVVEIAERQLAVVRAETARTKSREHDSDRMALINTYYSKRARAHIGVIRMIVLTLVPLLAIGIVAKKGWIGTNVAAGVATCISMIGGFFVLPRVWDLSWRSNMNYDEYEWYFDPSAADPTVYEYDKEHLGFGDGADSLASDLGIQCAGAACCGEDSRFDKEKGKCLASR